MATRGAALGRDPELEDVLQDLEARLAAIATIRTREYDDKLAVVEAYAAPYALAFLHEIRRLDVLLRASSRKPRSSKRRRR